MNGPTEPASELRVAARAMWEMFIALTHEGFTEKQALAILGHMLAGQKSDE